MKRIYKLAGMAVLGLFVNTQNINAQSVSDFESLNLNRESYWNGSDLSGSNNSTIFTTVFESGDAAFLNVWDSTYGAPGYWSTGFAISSMTDSVTSGYLNPYSAKTAIGNNASMTYLVAQNNARLATLNSAQDTVVTSIYLTNATYAYNSMRDGDAFAKKFGGVTGNDADWFMVTIKGLDVDGNTMTDSVDFYLADFRFADNSLDYIVKTWESVDLTSLGNVHGLTFSLSSSDEGLWGMNTPAFLCLDDLKSTGATLVDFEDLGMTTADSVWNGNDFTGTPNDPLFHGLFTDADASFSNTWNTEWGGYWNGGFAYSNITDSVTSGSANAYSAKPGEGVNASKNYVISQNNTGITLLGDAENELVSGFYVSNSTFAAHSMRDGDAFAKQFGGVSGDDEDWFKLTIKGYNQGVESTDSVDFYLADYRFTDNSEDYILNEWSWVSLTALGRVDSVSFVLTSSDNGMWGMNTPAFFALDNFNGTPLSIKQIGTSIQMAMYPNPANEVLYINVENVSVADVQIIDLNGKVVLAQNAFYNGQALDVSYLPSGIYIVKVMSEGNISTQRLIVQ